MGVRGQVTIQAGLDHFDQVEGGMQGAQVPLAGLLRHLNDILAAFCWEVQKGVEISGATVFTDRANRQTDILRVPPMVGSILGTDTRSH